MSVDPSGKVLLDVSYGAADLLSPAHSLHAASKGEADGELITIRERGSGHRVAEISTGGWAHGTEPLAAAGDVIYTLLEAAHDPRSASLAGVGFDGQVLWRSPGLSLDDVIGEVVAYPGRIYVLALDGTVLCLEEPT